MTPTATPAFRPLTGLFEPSAIQQLADGRFLVVEDEKEHPFTLLAIGADGSLSAAPLRHDAAGWGKLDDLEGLAVARSGAIYAITSHSRDGDGETKKSREKLVRFRIDGDRAVAAAVVDDLKPALIAADAVLAEAARVADVKADGGLNIEALALSPDERRLLVGLRSPLRDGRAIVVGVDNPAAMFDAGAPPRLAARLAMLDLEGHGIRGMSYVPALAGYLVIGGPAGRESVPFRLWFWRGGDGDPACRVSVPGLPGFANAEGVCAAVIDGRPCVVIVSDDGNRQSGRCARYLLLDLDRLQIAA